MLMPNSVRTLMTHSPSLTVLQLFLHRQFDDSKGLHANTITQRNFLRSMLLEDGVMLLLAHNTTDYQRAREKHWAQR